MPYSLASKPLLVPVPHLNAFPYHCDHYLSTSSPSLRAKPVWFFVVVVQLLSHARLFATPWSAALQASLHFIISQSLLRLMSTESVMPPNHLSHPLSPPSPFAFNLFQHQSESFPMSQLFSLGGHNTGASASVLLMNIQGWFPLGLTDLISLQSQGLLRVFSSTTVQKHQFFSAQPFLWSSSHIHRWLPDKP